MKKIGPEGATIYGCLLDSYGEYWTEPGILQFNVSSPSSFTQVASGVTAYGGATIVGDKYYSMYYKEEKTRVYFPIKMTIYDAATFKAEKEYTSTSFTSISTDLAYDHTTKKIYGCFQNADYTATKTFGYLVFNDEDGTYKSEQIGEFPERMVALTVDDKGTLYAVGESGKFYTIDKNTGNAALVSDFGIATKQWGYQSMCYDKASGKIYWAGQNAESSNCLFEIDPVKGTATQLVYYWNETEEYDQIVGMYIKQEFAEVVIPNPATELAAQFTDANLTGELTFKLPSQDNTGKALSGKLQYEVTLNGQLIANGEGEPGGNITTSITAPANGMYTIGVTVAVGGTKSTTAQIEKYIGHDTPQSPSDVKATAGNEMADGTTEVTVSWTAPSAGEHGGYVDLNNIKYDVMRQPDGVQVASGVTGTSIIDKVSFEAHDKYYYEIVAAVGDNKSKPAQSNEVKTNSITFPFSETFDTEEAFNAFSVVDANRDGSTWKWEEGYASYEYNDKNAANDWLITPALKLKANKQYVLQFTAINSYPDERVAAYVGNAATPQAMTIEVVAPTEITADEPTKTLRGTFRSSANGVYHFGIKAMSDADMSTLYVDNITIEEMSAFVPDAVTELTVVAGEKGALKATIAFKTPEKCIDGTDVDKLDVQVLRDGAVVKTFTNIDRGQQCSFEDTEVTEGSHLYAVVPANTIGMGNKAEARVFVGLDIPGKVLNLKAVEDINEEGTVVLTWDAPEKGLNGGYVDPERITYYISKGISGAGDINNGNSTTFRDKLDISKGRQVFEGYNVYATNDKGSGKDVWQTVVALAGPSVKAPMIESLSGMKMKSGPWLTEMVNGEIGEAYWNPVDGTYQRSGTQDYDGGLWVF